MLPISAQSLRDKAGRHFWDGTLPPVLWTTQDLRVCDAYRSSAFHQGQYDVVWCIEKPLDQQGWRLHVDSLIRLVGREGWLVLRLVQNLFISVPALKSYLFRRFGISVDQISEEVIDETWIMVFQVRREFLEEYSNRSWTYAILTQGNNIAKVEEFCESIRRIDRESQIVIVGPDNLSYSRFDVDILDRDWGPYSVIAKKKNEVAKIALGANILFAHDRWVLDQNFLVGFDVFGYDFDYVAPIQFHQTGKSYPSLCAITDLQALILGHVYSTHNDKEVWLSPYLNGGLFVVKRHLLLACPMNPLLYHHQAEDVEFSAQLMQRGIPPRLNTHSSAITTAPESSTKPFNKSYHSDYYGNIDRYYDVSQSNRLLDTIIRKIYHARFREGASWPRLARTVTTEICRRLRMMSCRSK